MSIFTKLEIDVMQANEIQEASEIAFKYCLPAIVVHPGLSSDAIIIKNKIGGRFKIITPIDWPKGETFGTVKLRGLAIDSLETDGFEFLLTPNKPELETRNEARALTEFVKQQLSELAEVRFVLGTSFRKPDNIDTMCRGLLTVRTPTFIRTDTQLKLQIGKANPDEHNKQIKKIHDIIRAPVKICGNMTTLKHIAACSSAARFGVSLQQIKIIIKEFKSHPDTLRDLLDA